MSEKRNDLQGIRGIAILLVLLFHLMPSRFSYGFIGVDMFFVLSGYLMTMILSKNLMTTNVLYDFYSRRFKRIVPLFYCILTAVYIAGWFILIEVDKQQLFTDLKWSLTFTSNMQPLFEQKGYWDQITSYRFLVHCWSLGVEIQFYLIAPFLLGYCRKQKWKYIIYVFLALSLLIQLLAPPKISYGLLPSRIWQFLCGTVAYEIENRTNTPKHYQPLHNDEIPLTKESNSEKTTYDDRSIWLTLAREFLVVFLILIVLFDPRFVGETGVRMIGVFLTTAFICTLTFAKFSFVSCKPLVYIGDISYTLYLVHWPVIVFYRYYHSLIELPLDGILWCTLTMFGITILLKHTLEDFLLRTRHIYAFMVFILCVLFILVTIPFYNIDVQIFKQENKRELISNAIRINSYEDSIKAIEPNVNDPSKNYDWVPCHRDFEAEQWTGFDLDPEMRCVTESDGALNVLVVGNSIAYRAFPKMHELFKGRFKTMRLMAKGTVPGIYSSKNSPHPSVRYEAAVTTLVERFRPDIIFVVFASIPTDPEGQEMQAPVLDWKTDSAFEHLQKNFDFYSNHSRKIVVDLPYYINNDFPGVQFAQEINKRLKFGKSLDNLHVTRKQVFHQQHWQHERLRHINCSKCIINDIGESLYEGDSFYFYDRETFSVYVADGIHFTKAGLNRVSKQYEVIIENLIRELN